jgi:ABC-type polysaccharide/polyol phosphate transport system ATPase subunit
MSNDAIISVTGLGKKYRIKHREEAPRYSTLRDSLDRKLRNSFRGALTWMRRRGPQDYGLEPKSLRKNDAEEFWALRDVSFEVRRGEVVGIIGRNGAGKSTLLKILSRITEPTTGKAVLKGRVASLLEVGTGFHPELTGRENIYLNGAILGMSRAEIGRKFDEIVDFAEVESFLDTPVKRYSSGMYVRLAFAVSAFVEPEILIVDEVLAVGDQQFQRKCLGKMREVAQGGERTVLFVSHNMGMVRTLCQKAFHLQKGRLIAAGNASEVTARYLAAQTAAAEKSTGTVHRLDASLDLSEFVLEPRIVSSGDPVRITVRLQARMRTALYEASVIIHSENGTRVAILDLREPDHLVRLEAGQCAVYSIDLSSVPLMEGIYEVGFFFRSDLTREEVFALLDLVVLSGRTGGKVAPYPAQNRGFIELDYRFAVQLPEASSK